MGQLTVAAQYAIVSSGIFLWVGMLTGVWKYQQIRTSKHARAHIYVDVAHRSSLLYASASLILAVLASYSIWSDDVNLYCVVLNVVFFSFAILSYILHGALADTTNQFKAPYILAKWHLPKWVLELAMLALIVAELGSTLVLLIGVVKKFFYVL